MLLRIEMFLEALPALVVMRLQLRRFEREARRPDQRAGLEHERHRVADLVRLRRIGVRGFFEGLGVRAVARHAVVQARPARHEALGLRVVRAVHEAHELARDVAVIPGRTEGVLGREPARRKDHEVDRVDARRVSRRVQHEEDRWIRMVEADRADRIEVAQIIFVRRVIAVPGHHVERRMADVGAPELTVELGDEFELSFKIFVRGVRREEVARIREAVRTDHTQIRQAQQRAEVLAEIAARRAVRQIDREAHAARNHGDFERLDVELAHFRANRQAPFLRHDQQFAIGIEEEAVGHRAVGRVEMDRATAHRRRRAVARHRHPAVDEVGRRGRHRQRVPAQLIGRRGRHVVEIGDEARRAADLGVRDERCERLMHRARTDPIEPRAAIVRARRREGGARKLLGVQAVRAALWRVLRGRQRAGQRLGRELVGEAAHIAVGRGAIGRGVAQGCIHHCLHVLRAGASSA
ncbi:hypothetical protein PT2222_160209 [Paraburkholderia tropica]